MKNMLIRAAEWGGGIETKMCSTMEVAQHKEKCLVTLENISPTNRTRRIGNSTYRICRADDDRGRGTSLSVIMTVLNGLVGG